MKFTLSQSWHEGVFIELLAAAKNRAMKDAFIFGMSDDKLRQEALAKDFTYAQVMQAALGY